MGYLTMADISRSNTLSQSTSAFFIPAVQPHCLDAMDRPSDAAIATARSNPLDAVSDGPGWLVSPRRQCKRLESQSLSPHFWWRFKLSNDPAFAEKLTDIVGLYVDSPSHAVVLLIDEKSQIQAFDANVANDEAFMQL